jgi:hypothetical protein
MEPSKYLPSAVDQVFEFVSGTLGPAFSNRALEASSMTDDDTLFHSWDPMFAQSTDFSFNSI